MKMIYNLRQLSIALLIGSFWATVPLICAQTFTAQPIPTGSNLYGTYPYSFTGLLMAPENTSSTVHFGSGAVVKSQKVVFSCAHVVFDSDALDPWLNGVRWYWQWSLGRQPYEREGQLLRGYWHFVSYADAAKLAINSQDSFSKDFVVHYAYENTAGGGYAGSWIDGASQLLSQRTKLITGYPSGLYSSADNQKFLMHQTGPFSRAFTVNKGAYLGIAEVSTGSGNSGGPVWVTDGTDYYFAGVLVSGLVRKKGDITDNAGVYGLDSSSMKLIDDAIASSGGTVTAPVITVQPTSRRVSPGTTTIFSVEAVGSGLSYQWLFNSTAIPGATGKTLSLANVSASNAGVYQVVVINAGGETRSIAVTLSVDGPPLIIKSPTSQTVKIGQKITFSTTATGSPSPSFQWYFNGVAITGATANSWTIEAPKITDAGNYTCIVSNTLGKVTSATAVLTVSYSRLVNLSVRSTAATGDNALIAGFVVSGNGSKPLLVRGIGPTLRGLGVPEALTDPTLALFLGSQQLATNDNWGTSTNASQITSVSASLWAFALANNSLDSVLLRTLQQGVYTAQVSGKGNSSGVALIEVYDAEDMGSVELANLSARTRVGTGAEILIVGFFLKGTASRQVLIRAVGPTLGTWGVPGTLSDPQIALFRQGTNVPLATNDNWGGSAALKSAFNATYAFPLGDTSRDAAILSSLPPGGYSVQVSGVNNSTGIALVEVYAIPE